MMPMPFQQRPQQQGGSMLGSVGSAMPPQQNFWQMFAGRQPIDRSMGGYQLGSIGDRFGRGAYQNMNDNYQPQMQFNPMQTRPPQMMMR